MSGRTASRPRRTRTGSRVRETSPKNATGSSRPRRSPPQRRRSRARAAGRAGSRAVASGAPPVACSACVPPGERPVCRHDRRERRAPAGGGWRSSRCSALNRCTACPRRHPARGGRVRLRLGDPHAAARTTGRAARCSRLEAMAGRQGAVRRRVRHHDRGPGRDRRAIGDQHMTGGHLSRSRSAGRS